MSATEIVKIENTSGSTAWVKVAESYHRCLSRIGGSGGTQFYIGDEDPNTISGFPSLFFGGGLVAQDYLVDIYSPIWVQLGNNQSITVLRGSGYWSKHAVQG